MITFQIETIDDVREEIEPMLLAHYAEIATDKSLKPLDIDWEQYYEVEKLDYLRVMTARDHLDTDGMHMYTRGRLVGYFVSILCPNMHYSQTRIALNDIFYVAPEYRGGTVGYRLLKSAAADLKNLNCDILTVHMKVAHPFRNLLERLDFTLTEENWDKVL